jgi:hypothetical protein
VILHDRDTIFRRTKRAVLHLIAAIGWGCVLLSGNCAAQTAEPGPVRVGDRWTYETKDAATGDIRHAATVVVVDTTDEEITTRVSVRGKDRPNTVVVDRYWGGIDNGTWKYRPAGIAIVKPPLQVGKEWRGQSTNTNMQTGVSLNTSGVAKVVASEKITSPAGTFDTYRIEINLTEVDTKDQTKSAKVRHVFWYAPAVNRWVKSTYELRFEGRLRDSTVEELTAYARKP